LRKENLMKFDDLKGKVVIVTGASSGLGRDIACSFGKAGALVTVADINEPEGLQTAKYIARCGSQAIFVATDVTDQDQACAAVDTTMESFGRVDILVNNAGFGGNNMGNPLTMIETSDFDSAYSVILKGSFHCCKAVYNIFKKQQYGKIVNIASIAARVGNINFPQYSAAKAALLNFTQTLAKEVGPFNINVNAVCPGYIFTPMWERLAAGLKLFNPEIYSEASAREIFLDVVNERTVMKREQTGEDIANAVLFFSSDGSCNITGQSLSVCGGTVMY
jgi:3-oxoacyl-[acyl-carrier protein] reductase